MHANHKSSDTKKVMKKKIQKKPNVWFLNFHVPFSFDFIQLYHCLRGEIEILK